MPSESPVNVSRLRPFTLGDWLVDPRACQMSRGETIIKLRAQLMDLLVCLARRAGEIVLKDEILKEVWPGQYIAESGLSRCVAELRQFLQDDAQQPRYIETITKRGYRLVAPVVWVEPAPRQGAAANANDTGRQPQTPPADVVDAATTISETAGMRRRLARGGRAWIAIGGVTLALVAIVALVVLPRSRASVLTERDTVLLADVNNTTGDRLFDDALKLALAVNLEQAPFLHILPQDQVRGALARTGRAPETPVVGPVALDVCRREGGAVLLAGSIALFGSRYAIGIEAIACGTGETIGRALEQADGKRQVLAALEQTATQIRRRLGESRASLQQHDVPLERATTPSLEALKALSVGDDHRDHARVADALALYRQATELDPGFALAWARRGTAAATLDLPEETLPAIRKAYEMRERVSQPERFYIEAHYHDFVEGDPLRAIDTYRAWKHMYPGSVIPPNNLAALLSRTVGQYEAALPEAREAVRLGRYSSLAHANLVLALVGLGRVPEARQVLVEATGRGIDDRFIHRQLWNLALIEGDQAAMDREWDWASSHDEIVTLGILQNRATMAMAGGRLREGRRLWADAVAKAAMIGPARLVADVRTFEAEAEALVGDARAARVATDAALARDRGVPTLTSAAAAFALIGDVARAQSILDDIARRTPPDPASMLVWQPIARALVERARGRLAEATAVLQPVARFERGSDQHLVPLGVRGLVEVSAGRPKEAAATFAEAIRLRAIAPADVWLAVARLGLARALGQSGDKPGSLAAYDAFLDSWKNADPDAPLLNVARRERTAIAGR